MEISQIAGTSSSTSISSNDALGRDEFLEMLIAQLENQDPLNPQDGTEFTAQLAQFSSLEQEIAMRESLEEIAASLTPDASSTVLDLIGKEVVAETPFFEYDGGGETLRFDLAEATDRTTLKIRDETGRVVREIQLAALPAGLVEYDWNGLNDFGNPVDPEGTQVFSLTVDGSFEGNAVTGTVLSERVVSAADLTDPNGLVFLGPIGVPLDAVREVSLADASEVAP